MPSSRRGCWRCCRGAATPAWTKLDYLLLVHGLLFWVLPLLTGPRVGTWRVNALLIPTVLLGRKLSPAVLAAFVIAFALVAPAIGVLYFVGAGE